MKLIRINESLYLAASAVESIEFRGLDAAKGAVTITYRVSNGEKFHIPLPTELSRSDRLDLFYQARQELDDHSL